MEIWFNEWQGVQCLVILFDTFVLFMPLSRVVTVLWILFR